MNLRVLGCGLAAAAVFLAVALLGLSMVLPPSGCPTGSLQWFERAYVPAGPPSGEPVLPDGGEAVPIGSTFVGLETRQVYAPSGTPASPAPDERPDVLVLDCGDGTFLAYRSAR